MAPEILFEDDDILVCYKPAGMATQTKQIAQEDMESFLKNYRTQKGEDSYVGVVQRLDQPVEGILVFGKNPKATAKLSHQLQQHTLQKLYVAIITRNNLPKEDTLTDYMVKDCKNSKAKVVSENDPRAKKAILSYKVLKEVDDLRLIEIEIQTGRFHQIRCQLASRTAPILGDSKYGGQKTGRPLCLCCYKLSFIHPKTGEQMKYEIVPKGEDFSDFWKE